MTIDYVEEETNIDHEKGMMTQNGGLQIIPGLEEALGNQSWFRLAVYFKTNKFKEIKQVRAYSVQSLIGNAGGYVGLLVGYTIAELPDFFLILHKKFTNY